VDERLERSTLFDYAAERGLGNLDYFVVGQDKTSGVPKPLVSHHGHLGRLESGRFREILTDALYFHVHNGLWDLQPLALAHAVATDALSGSAYYPELMARLDENGDGVIDDSERGKDGMLDCVLTAAAAAYNFAGKGKLAQGIFTMYARTLKHSDPGWNAGSVASARFFIAAMTSPVALQLATGPDTDESGAPNVDPFFGIPFGTGEDGVAKWPSLQFTRYAVEMTVIYDFLYPNAMAHPEGKTFVLRLPARVPYAPPPPDGWPAWSYNPEGVPNIVDTDAPEEVFTAVFADGEEW